MQLSSKTQEIQISPKFVYVAVALLGGLYFLYYVRSIVATLFGAVIIMAAINPAVEKMNQRFRIPRIVGILFMYALLITIVSLAMAIIAPPLLSQLQLLNNYNHIFPPILDELRNFELTASNLNGFIDSFGDSVATLVSILTATFSGVFTVFTVLVMSSYLLIDRHNLYRKVGWFSSDKKHFQLAKEFIDSAESQLGGWVRGQLILMIAIGLVTYFGLLLLGVPFALPLAILAGFLEVLPNLGPTIAAMPAMILAYIYGGWSLTAFTTLFYVLVQQLENNLIVPKIMKDNADVNPLATILTILIGLQVAGIVGALLAVPVYIVIRTAYSIWRRETNKV